MASDPVHPLSPHLQIYRLPLTALLSIIHRITGVVLSLGLVFMIGILLAVAGKGQAYALIHSLLNGVPGQGLLLLWLLALSLHFCHGVRHLIWDTTLGFDRTALTRHSLWELFFAVILTALSWALL